MKRIFLALCLSAIFGVSYVEAEPSAYDWARNSKELAALNKQAIATIFEKGQAGFDEVASRLRKNGEWDPLALTTMDALTCYSFTSEKSRAEHAGRLLAAVKAAKDPELLRFYLNQLRKCGLPSQVPELLPLTKSEIPGIADLADMVCQALKDTYVGETLEIPESRAEAFQRELKNYTPDTVHPRLIKFLKDRDPGCVTIALRKGAFGGGEKATALWCKAFQEEKCPGLKARIADLLAQRTDTTSVPVLIDALSDPNSRVVEASALALLALDRQAFLEALPKWMEQVSKRDATVMKQIFSQLAVHELYPTLKIAYAKSSETGRLAALDFLQKRRVQASMDIAFTAIEDKKASVRVAGYRLLREIAGKDQVAKLVGKALLATGRVIPEAENAIAFAAERDTTGSYQAALLAAMQKAEKPSMLIALEVSPRIGGDELLKIVEKNVFSDDADISAEATRALTRWNGDATIPVLIKASILGKTHKVKVLSMRGLSTKGEKITPYYSLCSELFKVPGHKEEKKALAKLFTKPINVAKGKPVKANVATEQTAFPLSGITDGTLSGQWWGKAYPAQVEVDLQKVFPLSGTQVNFYYGDGRIYTFNIEVSKDGKNWKKVCGNEKNPQPSTKQGVRSTFPEIPARYVRLNILKNSANQAVHVLELQAFITVQMK